LRWVHKGEHRQIGVPFIATRLEAVLMVPIDNLPQGEVRPTVPYL
jgi:hypothetical protein